MNDDHHDQKNQPRKKTHQKQASNVEAAAFPKKNAALSIYQHKSW